MDGRINSIPTSIIIDTGTGTSIIGGEFFNDYLRENVDIIECAETVLLAANGGRMGVQGRCQVKLGIGKIEKIVTFTIVDDLKNEIIIGNNILDEWKIRIHFDKRILKVDSNEKIPIRITRTIEEIKVRLIKGHSLPPRSIVKVKVMTEGLESSQHGIIKTPLQLRWKIGLSVQTGIIEGSNKPWIFLVNTSNQIRKVSKGMTVAYAEILETDVRLIDDKTIGEEVKGKLKS